MKKEEAQEVVILGDQRIELDSEKLKFNETNLSKYYQEESSYYDYFSAQLAHADYLLLQRELEYDKIYNEKFYTNKDEGGSDKYVESKTKADSEVIEAREEILQAKYKKNLLQQHIRAWDKNHDNALSLGHMLRKEMDKLGLELKNNNISPEEQLNFKNLGPEGLDIESLKND